MYRLKSFAALSMAVAATLASAPSFSQESALQTKIGTEIGAPRAGALPMPAIKLGEKGVATEQAMTTAQPASSEKKLTPAMSSDVPLENK